MAATHTALPLLSASASGELLAHHAWPLVVHVSHRGDWLTSWKLPAPALLNLRASHLRPDAHAASAAPTGADPECSRGFCRDKGESCRCAKDCLHACVPGPIDRLAPQLLHHMLAVGEI